MIPFSGAGFLRWSPCCFLRPKSQQRFGAERRPTFRSAEHVARSPDQHLRKNEIIRIFRDRSQRTIVSTPIKLFQLCWRLTFSFIVWSFTRPFLSNVKNSRTGQYSIHTNIFVVDFLFLKLTLCKQAFRNVLCKFFRNVYPSCVFLKTQYTWNDDKATTWSRETSMSWLFVVLCFDCTAKTTCDNNT